MWVDCPTELDSPVLIFGFEVEDFAAICAVMVFAALFLFEGVAAVVYMTVGFALGLRRLKRGKPPGVLLHMMHHWDIMRIPGVLPVRQAEYSAVMGDFESD